MFLLGKYSIILICFHFSSLTWTYFKCNICFLCIIISQSFLLVGSWQGGKTNTKGKQQRFQLSWMPFLSIRPSLTSTSQRNIPHKQPTLGDLISPEGGDSDLPFIPSVLYRAVAITVWRGSVSSAQLWEYFPPWQSLGKESRKYEVLLKMPISLSATDMGRRVAQTVDYQWSFQNVDCRGSFISSRLIVFWGIQDMDYNPGHNPKVWPAQGPP